jgi:hypothetical protein
VLVIGEISAALVLLLTAAVLLQNLRHLQEVQLVDRETINAPRSGNPLDAWSAIYGVPPLLHKDAV